MARLLCTLTNLRPPLQPQRLGKRKLPQLSLFTETTKKFFGGLLLQGKRKTRRPLTTKNPIHFVFKASLATGAKSFRHPRNLRPLRLLIEADCRRFGVRLYRLAINFDHIHLILLIPKRQIYRRFISSLTSKISFKVGHGKKGDKAGRRFFVARPFSRILEWGRDYGHVCDYLEKNILEALGFIPYSRRKSSYAKYMNGATNESG